MKKGGIYTGYVESVDFPNKGNVIVKTEEDGQTIEEKAVVKNSILGQTVKFMVNKKKHGKCEGRLLRFINVRPSLAYFIKRKAIPFSQISF